MNLPEPELKKLDDSVGQQDSAPSFKWLALVLVPPRWMRLMAMLIAVSLVALLFHLGAKPFAGGMFAHPTDKLVHLLFYGGLAGLFWVMLGGGRRLAGWGTLCLAGGVGIADEFVQMSNPYRSASTADLIFDFIGILIAIVTLATMRARLLR